MQTSPVDFFHFPTRAARQQCLGTQRPLLNRERESFGESRVQRLAVGSAAGVGRELSPRVPRVTSRCQNGGKYKTPGVLTLGVVR